MSSIDDLPCGWVRIDDQRVILEANEEAARLVKRPLADILGQKFKLLLPTATRIFFQTHVFPELSERGRLDEVYVFLASSTGEQLPVLMNARRIDGPKATYVFAFLSMNRRLLFEQDVISSREAAERAAEAERHALSKVREVQAQLALQERLAALGTLAAGVAHEINNPLTFVLGNLESMAEALSGRNAGTGPLPRHEMRELVREAREGVDRIRGIVRSLKSLSRIDEGRREPVDVGEAAQTALRLCAHELRTRATVTIEVASPAPVVHADEGRLVQVIVNLLVNAAQAMPGRAPGENRIVVRAGIREGTVHLDVEDNGVGIPAGLQTRIFDPFFTTKETGVGTGLGLSVCHGIVTALGGSIQVNSVEGEGTRFRVVLPLSPVQFAPSPSAPSPSAPSLSAPATERSQGAPPDRKPRLLIVDDEASVLRTTKRVLRAFDVTTTQDGRDVVSRISSGEDFDVILCDLTMPDMSGIDVYDALRELAPGTARRMVFMTGGTLNEKAERFLESIPNDHIEKPFDVETLREACRKAYERAARR